MAESTLSLTYSTLKAEVGLFLGYGRGTDFNDPAWTTQQTAAIESCVRSGLRNFYFPPAKEGDTESYDWTFLKPTVTLQILNGTSTLPLPDDFGGFEGRVTLNSVQNRVWWPIDMYNEGIIRAKYSEYPTITGRPLMFSMQPLKGTSGVAGQRFQFFFFPIADQNYSIQFQYYVLPDYLDSAFPFHWGGAQHAETVLESCLAVAEQRLDDMAGVHSAKFMERLQASISADRKNKNQTLGPNRDRSDNADEQNWFNHYGDSILVYGKQY